MKQIERTALNDAIPPEGAIALLSLLELLERAGYKFVTPTPSSHERVLARDPGRLGVNLRDIFGWSLPFPREVVDDEVFDLLDSSGMLDISGGLLKSRLRVSSLGRDLYIHSAFPTDDKDAVFFGPDSYRFAQVIERELERCPPPPRARLVDIGTGTGVGGIVAARCCPEIEVIMTDINPRAIGLARINACKAGIEATFHVASELSCISGQVDLILANPPYIIDSHGRDYRHGGGLHGAEVALAMARDAVPRLADGGRFILYTGSAITGGGTDKLAGNLSELANRHGCGLAYQELDPDIFGEELAGPAYRDVERIALVFAVISNLNSPGV